MKVKDIKKLESEELERLMTDEEFDLMQELGFEYTWQLLDAYKDSAELSNEDEFISIGEFLNYIKEQKEECEEI